MAEKLNVNLSEVETADCHLLPCKIKSSGDAAVSTYFTSTVDEIGEYKKCSFRGRPLMGKEVALTSDYIGIVVENKNEELCVVKKFEKFTYWNLDKTPSKDDALMRMMDWLDVSNALHQN
ncbi:ribonuclease H2 subunit C-like [Centruroides vittatus]|uniref:ribonuclease H2 subunit C-like n=1 Tax=Centruroides vittatus TaxID=120091 RepID=UPI0035103677